MEERITSRKNPALQQVRKLISSRKERENAGLFVADGIKLLQEAVQHCPGLETVILSDGVEFSVPEQIRLIRVPEDVMESISPMAAPQGAVFVCRMPRERAFIPKAPMLLLDGIQDPGNLGTILRTADAMNVPVALLEGCADPYNHKVVRASMGASFRAPVVQTTWEEAQQALKQANIPVAVTALTPQAEDIRCADVKQMAVVIGSEGRGVREEILRAADRAIIIPMNDRCESLNAGIAAAIVAWQMQQV